MKFMPNTRLRAELLKRIAEHCLGCAADGDSEGCVDRSCPVWEARLGSIGARRGAGWLLGRVRSRCGECVGFDARNLALCSSYKCSLWEYRTGEREPTKKPNKISDILFCDSGEDIEDILFGKD